MGCRHVQVRPMASMEKNETQESVPTASQLNTIQYIAEEPRQSSPEPIVVFRKKLPVVSNESGICTAYSDPPLTFPQSNNHQNTKNRRNLVELDDPILIANTIIGPASVKSKGSSINGEHILPSLTWDSNVSDISEDSSISAASNESEELYETYGPANTPLVDPKSGIQKFITNGSFLGDLNQPNLNTNLLSESDISQSARYSNASKISADSEGSVSYQLKYRRIIPIRSTNYVKGKLYESSDDSEEPELQDVTIEPNLEFHEVDVMRSKLETTLRSVSTKLSNLHDHHQKLIISETSSEADEP